MCNKVEQVMVMASTELAKQGVVGLNGIYPFDLTKVDPSTFGFLPRLVIDAKKTEEQAQFSIAVGKVFPQLISYFVYFDKVTNKILTYRRKGKEQGLLGKYSIGIGGHIDIEDAYTYDENGYQTLHDFNEIITGGIQRELLEETGLVLPICSQDIKGVIASDYDTTCKAHIALLHIVEIEDISRLRMGVDEFPGIEWFSIDELVAINADTERTLEPWSMFLVEAFNINKSTIDNISDLDAVKKATNGVVARLEDVFDPE